MNSLTNNTSVAISETLSRRLRQRSRAQPQQQQAALTSQQSHYFQPFEIRVTSSTYHLSQVALRELIRRIRLEIPDFPPDNLVVELGDYGAFDIRIGNSAQLCEASRTVTYPPVGDIVARLAKAMETPNGLADLEYELHEAAAAVEKSRNSQGNPIDAAGERVSKKNLDAISMGSSESSSNTSSCSTGSANLGRSDSDEPICQDMTDDCSASSSSYEMSLAERRRIWERIKSDYGF